MTVTNSAPTAGAVAITPASPTTTDTLTATPSGFSDPDGDTLTYTYPGSATAPRSAVRASSTLNLATAGNGDKSDDITVEVQAGDGTLESDPATDSVTVTNSAPTAGTVVIAPASPATTDTLTATPSGFSDPDGDTLTYAYAWKRNGTAISGESSSTLNLATIGAAAGDSISVDIQAGDGTLQSDPASGSVTVENSAPSAGAVAIAPASPATTDTLTAAPSGFSDPDGDTLTYAYIWKRNGIVIFGQAAQTLDLSQLGNGDKDDEITVEVQAGDGTTSSDPATDSVTVTNSAPSAGTVAITPASPATTDTLTAAPSGFTDPDNDTLTYTYTWKRNGTAIIGQTARR